MATFGSRIQTPKYTGEKCLTVCRACACPNPYQKTMIIVRVVFFINDFEIQQYDVGYCLFVTLLTLTWLLCSLPDAAA